MAEKKFAKTSKLYLLKTSLMNFPLNNAALWTKRKINREPSSKN